MGYDIEYGARPLKRLIQKEVGNALSEFILRGDYVQGQKVNIIYANEKVGVLKL
jgi:ATP-dependent Clp protease ATP-binding subunit ClpB